MDASMDQFEFSQRDFLSYPNNLIDHPKFSDNNEAYTNRLLERSGLLFCSEDRANLKIWEYDNQSQEFLERQACSLGQLQQTLLGCSDPKARFIFISAFHSRSSLKITHEMLLLLLTHLQVMPSFLDLVMTFGKRHYAHKYSFCGIRVKTRLSDADKGQILLPLGRSGRDFSLCYNFKGVETSPHQGEDWPWAIRQTAVYHSFDVVTGRVAWIIIKANDKIEERVKRESMSYCSSRISSFDTNSASLGAALATHLILTDWLTENWGLYIEFLEESAENLTRRETVVPVDIYRPATITPAIEPVRRTATDFSCSGESQISEKKLFSNSDIVGRTTPFQQFPAAQLRPVYDQGCDLKTQAHVRIEVLQGCQQMEEKTREVIQALESNSMILKSLVRFYKSILASKDCPQELKLAGSEAMKNFEFRVQSAITELEIQRLRTESISNLINGRENLFFGILAYCNMDASKNLAEQANRIAHEANRLAHETNYLSQKASSSAEKVERITVDMQDIAHKTSRETVSMRIITLVTLFFLPGTFVATMMSTDIIRWRSDNGTVVNKSLSTGALLLFLEITLPAMLLSFGAWYAIYWWVSRPERKAAWPNSVV